MRANKFIDLWVLTAQCFDDVTNECMLSRALSMQCSGIVTR